VGEDLVDYLVLQLVISSDLVIVVVQTLLILREKMANSAFACLIDSIDRVKASTTTLIIMIDKEIKIAV
jgi:hypothetical protein